MRTRADSSLSVGTPGLRYHRILCTSLLPAFRVKFNEQSGESVPSITQSASSPDFNTSPTSASLLHLLFDSFASVKMTVCAKLDGGLLSNLIPDSYPGPRVWSSENLIETRMTMKVGYYSYAVKRNTG